MSDQNCDSIDGIRSYLALGLAGLRDLQRQRGLARDRGTELQTFILLGCFLLDSGGSLGRLRFFSYPAIDLSWLPSALPDVLARKTFHTVLPNVSCEWEHTSVLPTADDRCPHCERGWDLSTIHDVHVVEGAADRAALRFQHLICAEIDGVAQTLKWATEAVQAAGVRGVLQTVPNGYWPDTYTIARAREPWCELRTRHGTLVFGWRKRVIELSWSDVQERRLAALRESEKMGRHDAARAVELLLDARTMFPKEDVTRDGPLIHAWNKDKFVQYLRTLNAVLDGVAS